MKRRRLSRNALAEMGIRAGFLTASERSKAVGISRSHILHLERGDTAPSAQVVDRMAKAYNRTVEAVERASAEARESLARRVIAHLRDI